MERLMPTGGATAVGRLLTWAAAARGTGEPFSVLSIDLDRFKRLNDTLGHAVGDEALKVVAALLSASARAMDLSARMGGDEFCMLLPGADADVADSVARRLQVAATEEFRRRGWPLGMSIGTTTTRGDAETVDGLLRRADEAMYLEKRAHRELPPSARAGGQSGAAARQP